LAGELAIIEEGNADATHKEVPEAVKGHTKALW
jgi:hypothetical protein